MAWCKHYIIGCSVGVMSQPSAIGVIEQISYHELDGENELKKLQLRHLERLPLDKSYPDLTARIRELRDGMKKDEQGGKTDLVIDITGVGNAVADYFRKEELDPIQAFITAGHGESEQTPDKWRISKRELVGPLQVLLQTGKLQVSKKLELVEEFKRELINFRFKSKSVNGDDIESWREGQFDDLIFSVALAAWRGQEHIPTPARVMDEFYKKFESPEFTSWVA